MIRDIVQLEEAEVNMDSGEGFCYVRSNRRSGGCRRWRAGNGGGIGRETGGGKAAPSRGEGEHGRPHSLPRELLRQKRSSSGVVVEKEPGEEERKGEGSTWR